MALLRRLFELRGSGREQQEIWHPRLRVSEQMLVLAGDARLGLAWFPHPPSGPSRGIMLGIYSPFVAVIRAALALGRGRGVAMIYPYNYGRFEDPIRVEGGGSVFFPLEVTSMRIGADPDSPFSGATGLIGALLLVGQLRTSDEEQWDPSSLDVGFRDWLKGPSFYRIAKGVLWGRRDEQFRLGIKDALRELGPGSFLAATSFVPSSEIARIGNTERV